MLCIMNFKTKMPIQTQLDTMEDIQRHQFKSDLIVAPTMLQPNFFRNFEEASQDITISKRTVGEISADELHYLGIKYAFVGHLERRIQLHETYDVIHDKLVNALNNNIVPIICMGSRQDKLGIQEEFKKIICRTDLSNKEIIVSWESIESTLRGERLYSDEDARKIFDELKELLSKYQNLKYTLVLGGHVGPKEVELAKQLKLGGVLIGDRFTSFKALDTILKPLG